MKRTRNIEHRLRIYRPRFVRIDDESLAWASARRGTLAKPMSPGKLTLAEGRIGK